MKNLAILLSGVLFFSGCKEETFFDLNFYVNNNTTEIIRIEYSIRVCSAIDNGCQPEDFMDEVPVGSSVELYVRDKVSEDADIRKVFSKFEIYNGNGKSSFDFWESDHLVRTVDDVINYQLNVDESFF